MHYNKHFGVFFKKEVMMNKVPFYVVFELSSCPILARQTYLDGLLAYCTVQEAGGDISKKDDLPLEEHSSGIFHASQWFRCGKAGEEMPFFGNVLYGKSAVKSDMGDVKKRYKGKFNKNYLNEGNGPYKSYQIALLPVAVHRIVFFGKGNVKEVERLLKKHIKFLGHKRSLGYGQVSEIIVREMDKDVSLLYQDEPMRPLPVRGFDGLSASIGPSSVRSPYWDKLNCEMCYLPTMRLDCPVQDWLDV